MHPRPWSNSGMGSAGTVTAVVVLLVSCKGKEPAPAIAPPVIARDAAVAVVVAGPVDAAAGVTIDAAIDAAEDDRVYPEFIVTAFGGHLPRLPLLSADGKLAAIDVSHGLGLSSVSTYEVGLLRGQRSMSEHLVVIDLGLARRLLEDPPPAIPKQRLATAAAAITRRLAGFTPFATHVGFAAIQQSGGTLKLGTATLTFAQNDTDGLDLTWSPGPHSSHANGLRVPVIPRQYTDREGGRCGGVPKLAGVWWDQPRDRLLVEVIYPGHDTCQDEDPVWLVF